jgi:hypothetical protein
MLIAPPRRCAHSDTIAAVDYSTAKRIGFVSTCPNDHLASQEYDRLRLKELLSIGDVDLYCVRCDMHWKATEEEKSNLHKLLDSKVGT